MTEIRRELFDEEHESFRSSVRSFLEREVLPHHEQWETDGVVSRDVWLAAGRQGLLGFDVDEQYGGGGTADFRYNMVLAEEMTLRGMHGPAFPLHNDIILPYLTTLGTDEQKARWLPGC